MARATMIAAAGVTHGATLRSGTGSPRRERTMIS